MTVTVTDASDQGWDVPQQGWDALDLDRRGDYIDAFDASNDLSFMIIENNEVCIRDRCGEEIDTFLERFQRASRSRPSG